MRFPSNGTGRDNWPCLESENAALIRLLKTYAPMLPQRADLEGALDFRTNHEDPDEPNLDEPEPVRVRSRLNDPLDLWNDRGLQRGFVLWSGMRPPYYDFVFGSYEDEEEEGEEEEEDEDASDDDEEESDESEEESE